MESVSGTGSEEYISQATYSEDSSVPEDILKFYHSYGCDASRRNNLHMLDEDTLVFINGNYLHFFSISLKTIKALRRSAIGHGLGHITIHPSFKCFAVGEKGLNPCIVVYTWPDLTVYKILRRGTTRGYAFINYNSSGELLCSQGIEPDYMLTIWDWEKEKIVLRCKAFSQDVFQATFSPTNPGDLTTCGVGHIRFWKMAETFTGLKLQGAIGRFGKTEISDIQCYASIGGGKVISGCEWGNILIWDGGLIVVEVVGSGGKTCHNGEITVMVCMRDTPELLTIGMDGYVKIWEMDSIEIADTIVSDDGKFEIEPIHELKLSSLAKPVSAIKSIVETSNIWFVQDSWGKVWNVDITKSISNHEYKANTVFYCPGGGINAIATSPMYTMMVIGTTMGHMWLMEYINKECIARKSFEQSVTKIIWLSTRYDPSGTTFLAAFNDGNIRTIKVRKRLENEKESLGGDVGIGDDEEYKLPFECFVLDRLRVHKGGVLILKLDEDNDVLYSCGEDRVIFAISVYWDDETNSVGLYPLSYVTAPFPVCSLDLHPQKDYRMIIAGKEGRVAECRKPEWGEIDTSITYNQGKLHGRRWLYTSVKSNQRQEERRIARKKERDKKHAELVKEIKAKKDTGIPVEEEQEIARLNDYYRRAQQVDDDEPLYIPEKPCPILAIYYHINKNLADPSVGRSFFIHVGGYDAGYIYECNCLRPKPAGFHVVPSAPPFKEDVAIQSFTASEDDEFLIFGMADGSIRVIAIFDPDIREEREAYAREKSSSLGSQDDVSEESEPEELGINDGRAGGIGTNRKKTPPFKPSIFPYDLEDFMTISMHDPDRGAVNDLAWSFDSEFLFSVGADGSIFAYRWDPAGTLQNANDDMTSPSLPRDTTLPSHRFQDSEESTILTLEEQKRKDEEDRIFNLAEEKKEVIRKELRKMKIEYKKIKLANNNIPEKYRLSGECFKLDQRIYELYRENTRKEVEMVYKKLEYEAAKSIILIEKIQKNFLAEILTPHIIVKDVGHTIQVHTIRNRVMSNSYEELVRFNKALMIRESTMLRDDDEDGYKVEKKEIPPVRRVYAKELIGDYENKKYNINTIHAIRNLERRLEKRFNRESRWRELDLSKIPDNYVAPEDTQALKLAKATTGDYKLKTSNDYLGEQITISVRRQRVLDLKREMFDMVADFNKNVVGLRDEKYYVIQQCRKKEEELKRLRKLIPKELRKPIPHVYDLEPYEEPEKKFVITAENILERQKKKLMAISLWEKKDQIMEELQGSIKLVDFTKKGAPKSKKTATPKRKQRAQRPQGYAQTTRATRSEELEDESMSTHKYRKCVFNPKTIVAKHRYEFLISQRCFEQDTILSDLNKIIDYYKDRVRLLRDERIMLQLDLKLMSLRLMNMIAELQIVKDFESEEKSVMDRLRAQKVECVAAKERLDKAKHRLTKAKHEQQKMEDNIMVFQKEAGAIIAEKPKHADYLWKVFKRKIHVEFQGETEEGEGDEDEQTIMSKVASEQSSESASTNSTSQDSNSDMFKLPKLKLDVNVCPDNLDKELYNRVCDLREKKAQLENDIEMKKKFVDRIISDCNEIDKIHAKFEGRLHDIGQEVAIVQRKKQGRMNDLMALCILKADQIQCLDDEEMERVKGSYVHRIRRCFPGHNELIIFPKNGITKLDLRAEELKDEAAHERDRHKQTTQMLMRLQQEVKSMENKVIMLNAKLNEQMHLKFGQFIDLDDVSAAIINLELLNLQLKVEQHRNQQYKERSKAIKAVEKEKHKLTEITRENSDYNILMAKVIERKRDVDYFMNRKSQKKAKERDDFETPSAIRSDASYKTNSDIYSEMERIEKLASKLYGRMAYLRSTISEFQKKDGIPDKPLLFEDMPEIKNMLVQVHALQAKYNTELQNLYENGRTEHMPTHSKMKFSETDGGHSDLPSVPPHSPQHLTHHFTRERTSSGEKEASIVELYHASMFNNHDQDVYQQLDMDKLADVTDDSEAPLEVNSSLHLKLKQGSYYLINALRDDQMPISSVEMDLENTNRGIEEPPVFKQDDIQFPITEQEIPTAEVDTGVDKIDNLEEETTQKEEYKE